MSTRALLLLSLPTALTFSTQTPYSTGRVVADVEAHLAESGGTAQKNVYDRQYSAGIELDQAAYESPAFWAAVDAELPGWRTDPALKRFRGFCKNLCTREPGKDVFLPNGQQILAQYEYPGLDGPRAAYPTEHYEELAQLQARRRGRLGGLRGPCVTLFARRAPLVPQARLDNDVTPVAKRGA